MSDVRVIRFGKGEWAVEHGKMGDTPAVFIEPVEIPGIVGNKTGDITPRDVVLEGGYVLKFDSVASAEVLVTAIMRAVSGVVLE